MLSFRALTLRRFLHNSAIPCPVFSAARRVTLMPPKRKASAAASTSAAAAAAAAAASPPPFDDAPSVAPARAKRAKKALSPPPASDDAPSAAPAAPPKSNGAKKAAATSEETDSPSAPPADYDNDASLLPSHLPRNKTVPESPSYPIRPPNHVRVAAWNITSLASSLPKGSLRVINALDADIVVLTETKVNELTIVETPKLPIQDLIDKYPHRKWGIDGKKGYAGVAILSKVEPIAVTKGLPTIDKKIHPDGYQGRILTFEYPTCFVVGTYVVNAGEKLVRLPEKVEWCKAFATYLGQLEAKKPVIWTGDFNVVIDSRDLSWAKKKWGKSPGYTPTECDLHNALLAGTVKGGPGKLLDMWRNLHPDELDFSFFGARGDCRSKGIGWRLDSVIVSEALQSRIKSVEIVHDAYGASDHLPIYCDIEGSL